MQKTLAEQQLYCQARFSRFPTSDLYLFVSRGLMGNAQEASKALERQEEEMREMEMRMRREAEQSQRVQADLYARLEIAEHVRLHFLLCRICISVVSRGFSLSHACSPCAS